MGAGVISEGILIIASVIVAGLITGVVITKVGTFEGYYTATTEAQKEKMLTKFEIIHVTPITGNSTSVYVWMKNIGLTPILELGSADVYFGKVNAVGYAGYADGTDNPPDWGFADGTTTSSVWSEGQTIKIDIENDVDLVSSQSYVVQFVLSNGVTDDHIFSVP